MANYADLGRLVKSKYPEYGDMDEAMLGETIAKKYPEYATDFGVPKPTTGTVNPLLGKTSIGTGTTNAAAYGAPTTTPKTTATTPIDTAGTQETFKKMWTSAPTVEEQNKINETYKSAYGTGLFEEPKTNAVEQKKKDALEFKNSLIAIAKRLTNLLDTKGKYDPQTYENKKSSLTEELVMKKKKADELGTALTPGEMSILIGAVPQFQITGQSQIDKWIGRVPPQTTKVLTPEEQIRNQMTELIAGYEGRETTPADYVKTKPQGQGYLKDKFLPDLKENVNNFLGAPYQAIQQEKALQKLPLKEQMIERAKLALAQGVSSQPYVQYADTANKVLGEPLKGGDIAGKIAERAYDKPVTSLMDVGTLAAPFLPVVAKGKLAKSPGEIPPAQGLPKIPGEIPNGGLRGKMATGIATIDPSDVIKSENGMIKALRATKGKDPRAMAIELKQNVMPKAGNFIDNQVKILDTKTAPQGVNSVVGEIMAPLENNAIMQSPDGLKIKKQLNKILTSELSSGRASQELLSVGETHQTSIAKMNEARKFLNSSIPDKWFESRPNATYADQLNSMKWSASEQLRNMITSMDDTGRMKDALTLQHMVYEAYPALSNEALRNTISGAGLWSRAINFVEGLLKPVQVRATRAMLGKNPNVQSILQEGSLPPVPQSIPLSSSDVLSNKAPMQSASLKGTALEKGKGVKQKPTTIKLPRKEQIKVKKLPPIPKYMWR